MERTDTTDAAVERYIELLRERAPSERLAQAMRLSMAVRELAIAGLRERHPLAGEHEIRVRLVVRLYGRELALKAYGSIPDDAL